MAIEIVDFPINSMVIFHGKMLVHQRVSHVIYHSVHAARRSNSTKFCCSWMNSISHVFDKNLGPFLFIPSFKIRKCLDLLNGSPVPRWSPHGLSKARLGRPLQQLLHLLLLFFQLLKGPWNQQWVAATKKFMGFWICVSIYYIYIYSALNHRVEIHDEDLSTWKFTHQCGDVQKWSQMIRRLRRIQTLCLANVIQRSLSYNVGKILTGNHCFYHQI